MAQQHLKQAINSAPSIANSVPITKMNPSIMKAQATTDFENPKDLSVNTPPPYQHLIKSYGKFQYPPHLVNNDGPIRDIEEIETSSYFHEVPEVDDLMRDCSRLNFHLMEAEILRRQNMNPRLTNWLQDEGISTYRMNEGTKDALDRWIT